MPFDGVLFGSWAMIAKEAHTSDSVKQLLVRLLASTMTSGNGRRFYVINDIETSPIDSEILINVFQRLHVML